MRLVLDTNVLVSAVMHPGRTPDRAVQTLLSQGAVVLYDARILSEYREVLGRKKFVVPAGNDGGALLARLLAQSECVHVESALTTVLIDDDDRAFMEVALAGRADALVSGNTRHFPKTLGFRVMTPSELLSHITRA